jgi:Cu2+-exporting ATPase
METVRNDASTEETSHADHAHSESEHGHDHEEHTGHGEDHQGHHAEMVEDFRRRFWVSLVATVPILALSPMIQQWLGVTATWTFPGDLWLLLGLSTFVYGYGGSPFLTGMVDELRERTPGMMTLVALAISVAYLYSAAVVLGVPGEVFFWETATLIDLMLVGHWIEMRSVMGASRALEQLARLMPSTAHRLTDSGDTEEVPIATLEPGDRVRVKSSEKIPADGTVVDGRSSVNESMLTGESVPVEKNEGDEVIAGSVNGTGMLVVTVEKTGESSYLNQIITLVREAQQLQSRTQNLADRAAYWLTLIALTAGALTFTVWFVGVGEPFAFSLERMVTVMVITCPHALGLAIPLVVAVSTGLGAQRGLLIRDRAAFERARNLDTVVFDKTGTLTEGRFGVTDVLVFDAEEENTVVRQAAAVEQHSEHPIAEGILRAATDRGLDVPDAGDFEALTGEGVRASVEGREVRVLSPDAASDAADLPEHDAKTLQGQGKTVVYVVREGVALGALALADVIREESREAIATLHDLGLDVVMLTGDNERVANWVAEELGLDRVIAEVLPDEKSDVIAGLQSEGKLVAMTGDGVNDAPALATADVGIAIGAGTDVAVETADIVLVESDPRDAVDVIRLAQATYRKMVQNLWWATGYNVVAIPLAAGVLATAGILLSPAVGAVLMSLSTVIVAVNARALSLD